MEKNLFEKIKMYGRERQVAILREIRHRIDRRASMIEFELYSSDGYNIYMSSMGERCEELYELRRAAQKKARMLWEIAGMILKEEKLIESTIK